MKICFEGPSAIGKTTLCKCFKEDYLIIPEVNELFKGQKNEGGLWYYQKQVERFQLSQKQENVIFDGDIFQPLWYNWTYSYPAGFLPMEEIHHFYLNQIAKGNISFPDIYFVFQTNIENLKVRKENDTTRRRGNFEKHIKLTQSLPKYFGQMKEEFPNLVETIEYDSIHNVKNKVKTILSSRNPDNSYDSKLILKNMVDWLSKNKP